MNLCLSFGVIIYLRPFTSTLTSFNRKIKVNYIYLALRSTVLRVGTVNSGGGSVPSRYAEPPLNDLYAPPTDMFSPPDGYVALRALTNPVIT